MCSPWRAENTANLPLETGFFFSRHFGFHLWPGCHTWQLSPLVFPHGGLRHALQAAGQYKGLPGVCPVRSSRACRAARFTDAVEAKGTPAELAELAWKAARNGEPWAIQMIFNRLEPQTTQLKLTHEKSDGPTIDYSRHIDSEVEGLESLLERATGAIAELEDGEGAPTAHEFVCQAWPVLEPETPFVEGIHVDAICEHLQAITEGRLRNLIINVPPDPVTFCTPSLHY